LLQGCTHQHIILSRQLLALSRRIDYIIIVPAVGEQVDISQSQIVFDQPLQTETGWLWASDHAGVLVEIKQ
jgi:endonuclease/exonuclease/phosphatase family metal-dependent hydrolase